MTITEIASYIILLEMVYALYMLPKTLGEHMGVFREPADPTFGKFKEDCKWTHGISFKSAAIGFVILLPIYIIIEEIIRSLAGMVVAAVVLFIILIPLTYYERKQVKINKVEAKNRNDKEAEIRKRSTRLS